MEVKEFFIWLVGQQLLEDQNEYTRTMEVALDERWCLKDRSCACRLAPDLGAGCLIGVLSGRLRAIKLR